MHVMLCRAHLLRCLPRAVVRGAVRADSAGAGGRRALGWMLVVVVTPVVVVV